ncbi:transposase domain-containing protein [Roseburia faecis]|uniref:transposase domain-containing protein n=2 Tax=Roseburia faecis TaxID=301302 RepID=UPI003F9AC8FD
MEHLPANSAHANVMLYILVETAQANQLNVYEYFELLLTEIPEHTNDTSLDFIDDCFLQRQNVGYCKMSCM